MSFLGLNKRRTKIIGSAFLAAIILMLILLVLPITGSSGLVAGLSSGSTGEGGGFSIHTSVYMQ